MARWASNSANLIFFSDNSKPRHLRGFLFRGRVVDARFGSEAENGGALALCPLCRSKQPFMAPTQRAPATG
jgi:hypothetical protein